MERPFLQNVSVFEVSIARQSGQQLFPLHQAVKWTLLKQLLLISILSMFSKSTSCSCTCSFSKALAILLHYNLDFPPPVYWVFRRVHFRLQVAPSAIHHKTTEN